MIGIADEGLVVEGAEEGQELGASVRVESETLAVVAEHLPERGEAAVVHVGRRVAEVAQARHLEAETVLGAERDLAAAVVAEAKV